MTMKRQTIGERIALELERRGFDGIAQGDDHLIYEIAHHTGIAPHRPNEHPINYTRRILAAIDRCDRFEKRNLRLHRLCRSYRLKPTT